MSFEWDVSPEEAFTNMFDAYAQAVKQAVHLVLQAREPEIENWMKDNALWEDRTGNARQALWAETFSTLEEAVLVLSHGVEYGIFLETQNAGFYAIIAPAMDHWIPILINDIQALLS